jgi:hypothetical protein
MPAAVIDDIRRCGDRESFAMAARLELSQSVVVSDNNDGAFSARGVHGQAIYIDPRAEMDPISTRPRASH